MTTPDIKKHSLPPHSPDQKVTRLSENTIDPFYRVATLNNGNIIGFKVFRRNSASPNGWELTEDWQASTTTRQS